MSTNSDVLNLTLSLAVPMEAAKYVGQPDRWESDTENIRAIGQVLASQGDELLYKQKGVTSKLFCELTKALAWSSFQPGGIRFNGYHYEVINDKLQIAMIEEEKIT
jgi:hypothetical protein